MEEEPPDSLNDFFGIKPLSYFIYSKNMSSFNMLILSSRNKRKVYKCNASEIDMNSAKTISRTPLEELFGESYKNYRTLLQRFKNEFNGDFPNEGGEKLREYLEKLKGDKENLGEYIEKLKEDGKKLKGYLEKISERVFTVTGVEMKDISTAYKKLENEKSLESEGKGESRNVEGYQGYLDDYLIEKTNGLNMRDISNSYQELVRLESKLKLL